MRDGLATALVPTAGGRWLSSTTPSSTVSMWPGAGCPIEPPRSAWDGDEAQDVVDRRGIFMGRTGQDSDHITGSGVASPYGCLHRTSHDLFARVELLEHEGPRPPA